MSRPAIATPNGRRVWRTRIVWPCAASTSGRRRYACGASSRSPPAQLHALFVEPAHHFVVADQAFLADALAIRPGDEFSLRRRARHDPSGTVDRRIQRGARLRAVHAFDDHGVVAHAAADKPALTRKRRGSRPLRTTQYVSPSCSSAHAKLWWLCTSSSAFAPRIFFTT